MGVLWPDDLMMGNGWDLGVVRGVLFLFYFGEGFSASRREERVEGTR